MFINKNTWGEADSLWSNSICHQYRQYCHLMINKEFANIFRALIAWMGPPTTPPPPESHTQ